MNYLETVACFILLIIFDTCVSQRELQNHELPRLIASLVPQANSRNPENTRNIILLRLDEDPKFELFDDIAKETMETCPDNPVIIHTDMKPFNGFVTNAVSFMIVTINYLDPVSDNKKKSQFLKPKTFTFFRSAC